MSERPETMEMLLRHGLGGPALCPAPRRPHLRRGSGFGAQEVRAMFLDLAVLIARRLVDLSRRNTLALAEACARSSIRPGIRKVRPTRGSTTSPRCAMPERSDPMASRLVFPALRIHGHAASAPPRPRSCNASSTIPKKPPGQRRCIALAAPENPRRGKERNRRDRGGALPQKNSN